MDDSLLVVMGEHDLRVITGFSWVFRESLTEHTDPFSNKGEWWGGDYVLHVSQLSLPPRFA